MSLKTQLSNGATVIGSWITIGHPTVAELLCRSGFDWLAIDMEHSPLSISECQELIRVIDLKGVSPLVRVGANDPLLIKRAMDSGAHGVIVPMVNSAPEAQAVIDSVYYPPKGRRGVGLARAQGYGQDFKTYVENTQHQSVIVIQIEHVNAVNNIDAILSVKGIDALIIGPYDLSASLGHPGDFNHPSVVDALTRVRDAAKQHGIVYGMHVVSSNAALVTQAIEQGYRFIAYGVDFLFISESATQGLRQLRVNR